MFDRMDCFGLTDVGRVRPRNEDHFLIADLVRSIRVRQSSLDGRGNGAGDLDRGWTGKLLAVADGMGGHASGGRASTLVVECLASSLFQQLAGARRFFDLSGDGGIELLQGVLQECQARVFAEVTAHPECSGMGTTVTMAYIVWPEFYVAHVGDSRCYRLHDGRLEQLTRDHTVAQQFVDRGSMAPDEAKLSWMSNALWNVVGGPTEALEPDVYHGRLAPGDSLLLCSDGLNKHVPDEMVESVLSQCHRAEAGCRRLVKIANEAGGTDNVTVVVARFPGGEGDEEDGGSVLDELNEKPPGERDTQPIEPAGTRATGPETASRRSGRPGEAGAR